MPSHAVPLLLAAVLLAACAPSAKEVEEFTASLTLGPTLEASLQPGSATVTRPNAYNSQELYAEREVRIDVPSVPGLFEPPRPLGLRDRDRPQSAFDLATCQEAVRVFAAAGYQLVDSGFLLDPISCPASELSDLKAFADQDLPEPLRIGAPAPSGPRQLPEIYFTFDNQGKGTARLERNGPQRQQGQRTEPRRLTPAQVDELLYFPLLDAPVQLTGPRKVLRVVLPVPAPTAYRLEVSCLVGPLPALNDDLPDLTVVEVEVTPDDAELAVDPDAVKPVGAYQRVACDGGAHTLTGPIPVGSTMLGITERDGRYRELTYALSPQ